MSWVKINDKVELQAVRNSSNSNKKFRFEKKEDDNVIILSQSNQSPTECSKSSELHIFIKKSIKDFVPPVELDDKVIEIKNQLEENIVDEESLQDNQSLVDFNEKQKEIDEKYTDLYSSFNSYCEKYELTPLGLIVSVSHCLGVGNPREIVRAFLGYFQTACGFKGTNVIAIGSAASGKSFTLETALDMIPEEIVQFGVLTVAYFFRKYEGKDLTGRIFYIGDLGGDNDNQDTIKFRDALKQLTTDGKLAKGMMDTDSNEEMDMLITGYPALSYTSALEETINDQEKSRSVVLTPQPVDSGKLMVFDSLMESNGVYREDLKEVKRVQESVKGLVYKFNPDDFDFFNPYMFCIEELIKDSDDFNRKIQEFNAVLKLITLLDKPDKVKHQLYVDENYEVKDTEVILASKRDNINALNVFDSANLLPDEIRFANGILENYDVFDIGIVDEDRLFEDQVIEYLQEEYPDTAIGMEDGYLNTSYEDLRPFWFTVKSLRQSHRTKTWFKKSKNYINERIQRLVDEGILLNLGKDSKNKSHNVYILNRGLGESVEDKLPTFSAKDINRATKLFELTFPEQIDEYKTFLENDTSLEMSSIFEVVKPLIPSLPFLEDEYVQL